MYYIMCIMSIYETPSIKFEGTEAVDCYQKLMLLSMP